VAIILDVASDEKSSKLQLSIVLRFVQEGNVHENFVGLTDLSAAITALSFLWNVANAVTIFQFQNK